VDTQHETRACRELGTFYVTDNLWATMALLTLIAAGTYASKGPFWALSSEWLGATTAAVAAVGTVCVLTLGRNQPRTIPVRA
jgi:hypothetical protein